jgi:nicotinamide-nucleotide amidase
MGTAEIVTIGNELLLGDVLDTNTHWLCRQAREGGAAIRRVTIVPDEPEAIADAIGQALQRAPDLLILAGGLGPTSDDRTVASLAAALGRPLVLDSQALGMVQATYERLTEAGVVQDAALTEARQKMALLPLGAEPLANTAGAAPGVLLQEGRTTLVCLPGVPEELRAIYRQSLLPRLPALLDTGVFVEHVLVTDCGDESRLAPVVDRVARTHPGVYAKSRAKAYAAGVQLRITLSASGDNVQEVESSIAAAERDLVAGLDRLGVKVVVKEREG